MSKLLVLQITMLLLILVGALIKRIGIISKEGQKNINDLVIYLVLPCNIIKSFMIDCDCAVCRGSCDFHRNTDRQCDPGKDFIW